jgi:hypothetical protein
MKTVARIGLYVLVFAAGSGLGTYIGFRIAEAKAFAGEMAQVRIILPTWILSGLKLTTRLTKRRSRVISLCWTYEAKATAHYFRRRFTQSIQR